MRDTSLVETDHNIRLAPANAQSLPTSAQANQKPVACSPLHALHPPKSSVHKQRNAPANAPSLYQASPPDAASCLYDPPVPPERVSLPSEVQAEPASSGIHRSKAVCGCSGCPSPCGGAAQYFLSATAHFLPADGQLPLAAG